MQQASQCLDFESVGRAATTASPVKPVIPHLHFPTKRDAENCRSDLAN
jgi:hypothetical protein